MAGRRGETRKRITERRPSPKEKSPCAFTADGGRSTAPGERWLSGGFFCARVRTAGALTPRRFASSVLRQQKKPPGRQDGGRRGDDQGLRLRRKTLRCARVRTAGALTPRRFASSVLRQQKKPPERRLFLLVERKITNSIEKRQRKPGDLRVKDRRVRAIC